MPPPQTNLLQGTLDLLILQTLTSQELHGLGISRRIEQITQQPFQVKPAPRSPPCIVWKRSVGSSRHGEIRKPIDAPSSIG